MRVGISIDTAAAVCEGKNAFGCQIVEIDPTMLSQEEREELSLHVRKGDPEKEAFIDTKAIKIPEATVKWLQKALNASRNLRIEEQRKRELFDQEYEEKRIAREEKNREIVLQKCENWFSKPDSARIYINKEKDEFGIIGASELQQGIVETSLNEHPSAKRIKEECDRLHFYAQKQLAVLKAEEKAAAERKQAQLEDIVMRYGDESQQARWKEGVLPKEEAMELLFDSYVSPATVIGISAQVVTEYHIESHCEACEHLEKDKQSLTNDEYKAALKIRQLFPKAEYCYIREILQCEYDSSHNEKESYIRLSEQVGEFKIECDFALTEPSSGIDAADLKAE